MGHERDAATCLRTRSDHSEGADQLKDEPEADRPVGGDVGQHPEHDDPHAPARMENEVAAHHAGDRARRAETGDQRVVAQCERGGDVRQRSDDARRQIERRVAEVPEVVLDVVAEDPEKQHVPQQVHEAAVHEHGRESVR